MCVIFGNILGIFGNTLGIFGNTLGIFGNTLGIFGNTFNRSWFPGIRYDKKRSWKEQSGIFKAGRDVGRGTLRRTVPISLRGDIERRQSTGDHGLTPEGTTGLSPGHPSLICDTFRPVFLGYLWNGMK